MSESSNTLENPDLKLLAQRLALPGMPPQSVIAREAGVSQSTVSRAAHGKIRTCSRGALRLWEYVAARVMVLQSGPHRESAAREKVARPKKSRAKRIYHHDSSDMTETYDRGALAREAISGLQDYLDDAFDPTLVIEQLAVLRRAQDRSR